jgi:uncharacterized peroxidase-related enzyme
MPAKAPQMAPYFRSPHDALGSPACLNKGSAVANRNTKTRALQRKQWVSAPQRGKGVADDEPIMALALKPAPLSPAMAEVFRKAKAVQGFVPNVLQAFAFDMAKLEAFVAYRTDLMVNESGLSKLEREMIATVVSSQNRCYYCISVHGASVRALSGDPMLGELMAMNYRAARLSKRQRAMLDFAVKLTAAPWAIEEDDRAALRKSGFSDRDIWDIAAVAAFYNMTNRLASGADMRPNREYHAQTR